MTGLDPARPLPELHSRLRSNRQSHWLKAIGSGTVTLPAASLHRRAEFPGEDAHLGG